MRRRIRGDCGGPGSPDSDWDVGDLSDFAETLDQKGYAVELHEPREGHTWDQRRGLADEMLRFLFPPIGS